MITMGKRAARDPELQRMGQAMKLAIERSPLRQRDVADRMGVGERTLAGYLAGGGDMPLSKFLRFADAVEVDADEMITVIRDSAKSSESVEDEGPASLVPDTPPEWLRSAFEAAYRRSVERKTRTGEQPTRKRGTATS